MGPFNFQTFLTQRQTITYDAAIQDDFSSLSQRPHIHGKFIYIGEEKFWIKGVTYGTFRADESGNAYLNPEIVGSDFSAMRSTGVNTIRLYTPPPNWFLDLAAHHGLRVMVGLPWEQHVAFLDQKEIPQKIQRQIRLMVEQLAAHPAILAYVIGNEIPGPVVRWHGAQKIRGFLKQLSTENRGLSSARNTGMEAASGDIIAYIDDDAFPDPDWLTYLAHTFQTTDCAGAGGPNIPPSHDQTMAQCVANAPGGPLHVLTSDREAEHIPGCNMAFRRDCLRAINGFDPRFRAAGDDVDLCWRIQEQGGWIAFCPAAVVFHHRRPSIRAYWRQQIGYGKAEALLEQKWPEKYNSMGHLTWAGRIYGNGITQWMSWRKYRIYHGSWGQSLFQSLYEPRAGTIESIPLMPEWYIVNLFLAFLAFCGTQWDPLLIVLPFMILSMGIPVAFICKTVIRLHPITPVPSKSLRYRMRLVTGILHMLQPLARLIGRLRHGLTPFRRSRALQFMYPLKRHYAIWYEEWQAPHERIKALEDALKFDNIPVLQGGDYDAWDLKILGGLFGLARIYTLVEEHGNGRQLMRIKVVPTFAKAAYVFSLLFAILCVWAIIDSAVVIGLIFGGIAGLTVFQALKEGGGGSAAIDSKINQLKKNGYGMGPAC